MSESGVGRLISAIEKMARGQFDVAVPSGAGSELDEIGNALTGLGKVLGSRFSEQRALLDVANKICSGLVLGEVLDGIYDAFAGLIPYDRIGCALVDPAGKRVESVWARSEFEELEIDIGYSAPLEGSSLKLLLETAQPRILNDLQAYLDDHPNSTSTRKIVKEGVQSSLTCPLIADGRPVGFLFFSSRDPATYAEAHVALYLQIANQVSLIVERSRLYQNLHRAEEQLRALSKGLIDAQERERARYAHELHEDLGQLATAATLQLQMALQLEGEAREQRTQQAIETVACMLQKSRALALRLRPAILDDHGLGQAVRTYLVEFESSTGISVQSDLRVEREDLPTHVGESVYRVLQEALNNAAKHASVGEVFVALSVLENRLTLCVKDEGAGFAIEPTRHAVTMGLLEMRKRIELLAGQFHVISAPGAGTEIRAELPL